MLADGAQELWSLFSQHLNAKALGVDPVQLVDAWHALEYLAAAARLLELREKAWPGTFRRWKVWLLEEAGGAKRVVDALEKSGLRNARDASGNRPVGDALRYFRNRLPLMNYADARTRGLPIGSGAVEATCKSLVSIRMKRSGARWKHRSGNEILQLRALQLSDRWDAAMTSQTGTKIFAANDMAAASLPQSQPNRMKMPSWTSPPTITNKICMASSFELLTVQPVLIAPRHFTRRADGS